MYFRILIFIIGCNSMLVGGETFHLENSHLKQYAFKNAPKYWHQYIRRFALFLVQNTLVSTPNSQKGNVVISHIQMMCQNILSAQLQFHDKVSVKESHIPVFLLW